MNENDKINFDFVKEIKEPGVYQLLFPKKEVGLAVMVLFQKIDDKSLPDGKFIEKDLHDAFAQISKTTERYPKEIYSAHIEELQEYFLDYNQETQKYYFKDYAYRFYTYAKETLKGNFSPTHIEKICILLTASLRKRETLDDLKFWLKTEFKKYEPDLREQVDFLDRQIIESVNKLKDNTTNSDKKFIDLLEEVERNLDKAQDQSKELAAAYSETKVIRSILEKREDTDSEADDLIVDVHFFIKYLNERLDSIDRKLDRIQPKIRRLFAILNRPQFNTKVEKFLHFLLDKSTVDSKKETLLPDNVANPIIHIDTPNFTIVERERELFPSKPKKRTIYSSNTAKIEENTQSILNVLNQQDLISKWEKHIIAEIELRGNIDLSKTFFQIMEETNDGQIAVSAIYSSIQYANKSKNFNFKMNKTKQTNTKIEHISLWKMNIQKT
ncbi:hypothetical protein LCGC14_0308340 [marine sediment metagenome]|uniref:Uncharacterized protein n=1 Tax=marine sediment metagenome TaxID=412755 RepID=A0A0F9WUI5_9ZZZZ